MNCADCNQPITADNGPPWELEDGRTVCHPCAALDLKRIAQVMTAIKRGPMTVAEHVITVGSAWPKTTLSPDVMRAHTQWLKTEGKP